MAGYPEEAVASTEEGLFDEEALDVIELEFGLLPEGE